MTKIIVGKEEIDISEIQIPDLRNIVRTVYWLPGKLLSVTNEEAGDRILYTWRLAHALLKHINSTPSKKVPSRFEKYCENAAIELAIYITREGGNATMTAAHLKSVLMQRLDSNSPAELLEKLMPVAHEIFDGATTHINRDTTVQLPHIYATLKLIWDTDGDLR